MDEYINRKKADELLGNAFLSDKYNNLKSYCAKLLERYNLESKYGSEDILQEAALKILSGKRRIKTDVDFYRSVYMIIKSIIYNNHLKYKDVVNFVREEQIGYGNSIYDDGDEKKRIVIDEIEGKEFVDDLYAQCKDSKESTILNGMINKLPSWKIAEKLKISESMVKYKRRILKKRISNILKKE